MSNIIHGRVNFNPSLLTTQDKPSIRIAVPAYQNNICSELFSSVFQMQKVLNQKGIVCSLVTLDYADIVVSRNALLTDFYFNRPTYTHLLFLDADMGFRPDLITDMLELNVPVVGCVSPRRSIDLSKIHRASNLPFEEAKARSLSFIVNSKKPTNRRGKFIQVNSCGTGIFMISRSAIDTLLACCSNIKHDPNLVSLPVLKKAEHYLSPFNKIVTRDNVELSEDYSFCHRWVHECKGEIWASYDHTIQHVGRMTYEGKFSDLSD